MRKRYSAPSSDRGHINPGWLRLVVSVVIVGFLAWGGLKVWHLREQRTWNSEERLSIAWASSHDYAFPLGVFSYELDQPLVVLQLPPQVQVPVSFGYGNYEVRSLRGLAEQENKYNLLPDTVTDLLGTPIHDWVVSTHPDCDYTEEKCIKKLLWLWLWNDEVKTSLALWDRLQLWWKVYNLRADKVKVINASEGSWARQIETVDKKQMIMFDSAFIDARVAPLLTDTKVRTENVAVLIVNTVGEPGLARQVSRIVSGMGAWVVKTENYSEAVDHCLLKTHLLPEASITVRRITEAFGCEVVQQPQNDRYGIELWVGKDQREWWTGER